MALKGNWSETMIAHCGDMLRFIDRSNSIWASDMPEKEKIIRKCTIMAPNWNDPDLSWPPKWDTVKGEARRIATLIHRKPVYTKEPVAGRKEEGGNEVVQIHHETEATVVASQDDQGSALLDKCRANHQRVQDHLVGALLKDLATITNAPQGREDSPTAVHAATPGSAEVKGKGKEVVFEQDGEVGSARAGDNTGFQSRYTLEEQQRFIQWATEERRKQKEEKRKIIGAWVDGQV